MADCAFCVVLRNWWIDQQLAGRSVTVRFKDATPDAIGMWQGRTSPKFVTVDGVDYDITNIQNITRSSP